MARFRPISAVATVEGHPEGAGRADLTGGEDVDCGPLLSSGTTQLIPPDLQGKSANEQHDLSFKWHSINPPAFGACYYLSARARLNKRTSNKLILVEKMWQ